MKVNFSFEKNKQWYFSSFDFRYYEVESWCNEIRTRRGGGYHYEKEDLKIFQGISEGK